MVIGLVSLYQEGVAVKSLDDEIDRSLQVPWAISDADPEVLVTPRSYFWWSARTSSALHCPWCHQRVFFRKGSKRPHFYHQPHYADRCHRSSESALHASLKWWLAHHPRKSLPIHRCACHAISPDHPIFGYPELPISSANIRPDVLVTDQDGSPLWAIEIVVSHPLSTNRSSHDKVKIYDALGLPYVVIRVPPDRDWDEPWDPHLDPWPLPRIWHCPTTRIRSWARHQPRIEELLAQATLTIEDLTTRSVDLAADGRMETLTDWHTALDCLVKWQQVYLRTTRPYWRRWDPGASNLPWAAYWHLCETWHQAAFAQQAMILGLLHSVIHRAIDQRLHYVHRMRDQSTWPQAHAVGDPYLRSLKEMQDTWVSFMEAAHWQRLPQSIQKRGQSATQDLAGLIRQFTQDRNDIARFHREERSRQMWTRRVMNVLSKGNALMAGSPDLADGPARWETYCQRLLSAIQESELLRRPRLKTVNPHDVNQLQQAQRQWMTTLSKALERWLNQMDPIRPIESAGRTEADLELAKKAAAERIRVMKDWHARWHEWFSPAVTARWTTLEWQWRNQWLGITYALAASCVAAVQTHWQQMTTLIQQGDPHSPTFLLSLHTGQLATHQALEAYAHLRNAVAERDAPWTAWDAALAPIQRQIDGLCRLPPMVFELPDERWPIVKWRTVVQEQSPGHPVFWNTVSEILYTVPDFCEQWERWGLGSGRLSPPLREALWGAAMPSPKEPGLHGAVWALGMTIETRLSTTLERWRILDPNTLPLRDWLHEYSELLRWGIAVQTVSKRSFPVSWSNVEDRLGPLLRRWKPDFHSGHWKLRDAAAAIATAYRDLTEGALSLQNRDTVWDWQMWSVELKGVSEYLLRIIRHEAQSGEFLIAEWELAAQQLQELLTRRRQLPQHTDSWITSDHLQALRQVIPLLCHGLSGKMRSHPYREMAANRWEALWPIPLDINPQFLQS